MSASEPRLHARPPTSPASLAGSAGGLRPPGEPLSATLDAVAGHLPGALVSPEAMRAVRRLAGALPAALTDELYLECRLGADDARVDAILHLREGGRAVLAGRDPGAALASTLARRPEWRRLAELASRWADPGSTLHRDVCGLWLEFDLDRDGGEAPPVPGVFANLSWVAWRNAAPGEWAAAAAGALAPLLDVPVPAATLRAMRRAVAALPRGATMTYAGVFPGRGAERVRVCAGGVGLPEVGGFLRRAGWEGDAGEIGELLGAGDPGAAPGFVHLDLGVDGPAARAGVEIPLHRRTQIDGRIREAALLDRLTARGLAAPEKAAALGAWPGWSTEALPAGRSLVVRRVNHLKATFGPAAGAELKAYLCAYHTRRTAPRKE